MNEIIFGNYTPLIQYEPLSIPDDINEKEDADTLIDEMLTLLYDHEVQSLMVKERFIQIQLREEHADELCINHPIALIGEFYGMLSKLERKYGKYKFDRKTGWELYKDQIYTDLNNYCYSIFYLYYLTGNLPFTIVDMPEFDPNKKCKGGNMNQIRGIKYIN